MCTQEEENRLREELRQEWELKQEKIKSEYQDYKVSNDDHFNAEYKEAGRSYTMIHFGCFP